VTDNDSPHAPTRRATCACGQLAIECVGEPVRVSVCHCLDCKRRSGSAFATQARFARDRVAIEGRSSTWSRVGDSGGQATFHFCPTCSSIVYWDIRDLPDYVAVAVGAFADPAFPSPHVSVYEGRQHPWTLAIGQLPLDHDS